MDLSEFKCQLCGECCRWEGYVRLTQDEIEAISAFLEMDIADFTEKYTRLTDDRRGLSLIEHDDGSCIFLSKETGQCLINAIKPKQCKDFPLNWSFEGWDSICKWGRDASSKKP
jgi:Fe-S-cluster containining protein